MAIGFWDTTGSGTRPVATSFELRRARLSLGITRDEKHGDQARRVRRCRQRCVHLARLAPPRPEIQSTSGQPDLLRSLLAPAWREIHLEVISGSATIHTECTRSVGRNAANSLGAPRTGVAH